MKQELIVKANKLLQQPLYKTSIELKIFSMVLLKIRENPDGEVFDLNIKELMEHFEGSKENYTYLKSVAKKMFGAVDINPSEKGFSLNVVFTRIEVNNHGIMSFKLNTDIKPYILNLTNNFTQYLFENIARLKSYFSIRIYELLKQYELIGKRKETILYLRDFLNIEKDKYEKYSHFKSRILLSSQKEIKEKTDIYFEFEEIKKGRMVVEIVFLIFKKDNLLVNNEETSEKENLSLKQIELELKLINQFKISKKIANDLIKSIKIEQIESNIVYVEKEYKIGKVKKNFSGYLIDAIKNNYAGNISIFEIDQKERKVTEEKTKRIDNEREKLEFKLSKDFGVKIRADFIASLSEEEIIDLTNEIVEKVKTDKYTIDQIRRKGLLNAPATYTFLNQRIERFAEKKEQFIVEGLKKAGFES